MSEKDNESGAFRVVDRRRFDADGSQRSDAVGVESPRESQPSTKNQDSGPSDVKERQPTADETRAKSLYDGQQSAETYKVDFSAFIVGLGTQVLAMLGEIPNPENNQRSVNLDAARQTIDILSMLQEKTKGNLTEEESNLIAEMLASLQMAFVSKVNVQKGAKQ